MSDFNPTSDAPFQIKKEGETVTLNFDQGVPTAGQGTVSWNIPEPVGGCEGDSDGVYAGMLIVISTQPIGPGEYPTDGKFYTGDPTADPDLHAGDNIGGALVVGAFYECEEKGQGEDLTNSMVITDLHPRTAYYVAGFPVDCQFNYFTLGVRAYSETAIGANEGCSGMPARQPVQLGDSNQVLLSDPTGLIPGVTYEFDLVVDDTFPYGTNFTSIPFTFDGFDVPLYEDLLASINNQIMLADNPPQSPLPPFEGLLWWNDELEQLFRWTGYKYELVLNVIVEPTDPTIISHGTYWYNPVTKELMCWEGSPGGWVVATYTCWNTDPTSDLGCEAFWFDGTLGYQWNGTTWCEQPTVIDDDCPSAVPTLPCGTFWYDELNMTLSEWNPTTLMWTERAAIYWPEAPNALSPGTHWFNLEDQLLYVRNVGSPIGTWSQEPAWISTEAPPTADDNSYWYNPETEELQQYNLALHEFEPVPCLVWPGDPTDVDSCDLWWQAGVSPELLYVWDTVHGEWDEVKLFIQSEVDPSLPADFLDGTLWINPEDGTMCRWDGVQWVEVEFMTKPTDPTRPADGDIWYDCDDDRWFKWSEGGSPIGSPPPPGSPPVYGWVEFNPIDSILDPSQLPLGTYWYDTTNDALFVWNGSNWVSVMFHTEPYFPDKGDKWYDTDDGVLYCWDGYEWIVATPIARCVYDCKRNFLFESTATGTNTTCFIPVPEGAKSGTNGSCMATGYADFDNSGGYISPCSCKYTSGDCEKPYPVRQVPLQAFIWEFTTPYDSAVLCPVPGTDGKIETPSYSTIGVGDDGTTDERKNLIENVRLLLGAPTVKVELTYAQFDLAVDRALNVYRARSSGSLKRGFFFLNVMPRQQRYCLTNQELGYHKIVNVMAINRFTSAFLSSAHGSGIYGQVVLQHLYNMGTFDLTSFFLVSQYVEQLEHLFATRLTFAWDEPQRNLDFYTSFGRSETVLMDCAVEKTEQDIITQRWSKNWIEQWTYMESLVMLSQIRGKFASLPGAGGGVSLNASDLMAQAVEMREQLIMEIDDFIADKPEEFGMESTFVLG